MIGEGKDNEKRKEKRKEEMKERNEIKGWLQIMEEERTGKDMEEW